jgi:hypothetical protein
MYKNKFINHVLKYNNYKYFVNKSTNYKLFTTNNENQKFKKPNILSMRNFNNNQTFACLLGQFGIVYNYLHEINDYSYITFGFTYYIFASSYSIYKLNKYEYIKDEIEKKKKNDKMLVFFAFTNGIGYATFLLFLKNYLLVYAI